MNKSASPYVRKSKSWVIKNVISNYFKAYNLNADIYREYHSKTDVQFIKLRQLSEILFAAKEDLHLIYKRLIDPRRNIFEKAEKFTPNEDEIRFINNVGVLFHKVLVARELEYMLEFYETENEPDYEDIKTSLDDNIERLKILFERGLDLVKGFLGNFQNDAVVLSFLLENSRYVEAIMGESVPKLFRQLGHNGSNVRIYTIVASYFKDSGWDEKAKKILLDALAVEPQSKELQDMWALIG